MTILMQASRQWASRPADERYASLPRYAELHDAAPGSFTGDRRKHPCFVRVPVEGDHGFRWKMIAQSGGT
jgi:hypothetical protein